MQAVILAAGMGKRLKELTQDATKCMVKVGNVTMIERMLTILDKKKLDRIVLVVGYEGQKLKDFVSALPVKTPIEYVENDIYYKTNNIYSLFLARRYLTEDDTLLLESDLVFEEAVLDRLLDDPYPSLALVAKFESWMDGTVVKLDDEDNILSFISKKDFRFEEICTYYKTVNIYKFSRAFSTSHYVPFLEAYSKALGDNEYYEQVLRIITLLERPEIKAARLDGEAWYEIDDVQDLDIAESIFADKKEKFERIQSRYGGFWRYPQMLDFCYLVNPYFPNPKLIAEMKANFERLLTEYPSGMRVNSLLAAKYFGLHTENVAVGNGAAELIQALVESVSGTLGVVSPSFDEYRNRKYDGDLEVFCPKNPDFSYTADDLIDYFAGKKIASLVLINPDNPSGNYLPKADVVRLAAALEQEGVRLFLDESFVDFADAEKDATFFDTALLQRMPNVVVIKSISKSFGVPGLRLGVAASADTALISALKGRLSIWNINSFGEFYMQIFEKYKSEYREALETFFAVRRAFYADLCAIPGLRPIPSQANYILCEVTAPVSSRALAEDLLDEDNILIKDLSGKRGFDGKQYIRLAVRTAEDNRRLTDALSRHLG